MITFHIHTILLCYSHFSQSAMQTNDKECIVFHLHATGRQNISVNFMSAYFFLKYGTVSLGQRGREKGGRGGNYISVAIFSFCVTVSGHVHSR